MSRCIVGTVSVLLAVALGSGCAVHYYDPKTGAEHLWGVGHLTMKLAPADEGVRAAVKGTEILGVSLGLGKKDCHLVAGWDKRTELGVLDENTSVRLEWPNSDFFNVRVGSKPPFPTDGVASNPPSEVKPVEQQGAEP